MWDSDAYHRKWPEEWRDWQGGEVVSVALGVSLVHFHVTLTESAGGHENEVEMKSPCQERAELESRSIAHALGAEESFRGVSEKGGWKDRSVRSVLAVGRGDH